MNPVPFVKVQSLRNDFIIVDAARVRRRWDRGHVVAICDRRTGVGADGLILLGPESSRGIRTRLFNADGSPAEWSGNGIRGVVALLSMQRPRTRAFCLLTGAGPIRIHCRRRGASFGADVTFDRPYPRVTALRLRSLPLLRGVIGAAAVEAGNPHWVFWVRGFEFPWEVLGAQCQLRAKATRGVNVEFVRVKSRSQIELRIFERGAGPTPASGSGALAAVAACRARGSVDNAVRVKSPGGVQNALCRQEGIRLSARARIVYAGVWSGYSGT